jgi:hypothetical protein
LVIIGLGALLVDKLPSDALKLPAHVDFVRGRIDRHPGEPDNFAFTEPENEGQHVCGIERVMVRESRLKKLARFFHAP